MMYLILIFMKLIIMSYGEKFSCYHLSHLPKKSRSKIKKQRAMNYEIRYLCLEQKKKTSVFYMKAAR